MKKISKILLGLMAIITISLKAQDSLQQKIALKEITLDAIRIKTPKRIIPFAISHRTFQARKWVCRKIHFRII
jgi:hypothetical protein